MVIIHNRYKKQDLYIQSLLKTYKRHIDRKEGEMERIRREWRGFFK